MIMVAGRGELAKWTEWCHNCVEARIDVRERKFLLRSQAIAIPSGGAGERSVNVPSASREFEVDTFVF